jgi:putative OPT family oligopeptide transporter
MRRLGADKHFSLPSCPFRGIDARTTPPQERSMTDSTAAPSSKRAELTVRGILLGVVITVVFTAANVFFGLKAGLTFASSIPATVISMAVLRLFKNSTIQENNIVQTVASAAGTLSSIIFILPGLVIVGWWTGFPFWMSFGVCALGGILGVMYSIPLRRALVTDSDLPYPEGVACAEVLKVGSPGADPDASADEVAGGAAETRAGLWTVVWGSLASAAFALVVGTKVFAGNVTKTIGLSGGAGTGFNLGLSMALLGVGHLVGLWVGIAMLVGVLIAWLGAVPYLTAHHIQVGDMAAFVTRYHVKPGLDAYVAAVFKNEVRLLGAGVIGVAAIWTLLKLILPIATGLRAAMASQKARQSGGAADLPLTERDIPIGLVGIIGAVCLVPIAWMLVIFAQQAAIGALTWPLAIGGVIFIAIMGFLVSAVCGYMAGLIGSSNSPLSGVGILATVAASGLIVLGVRATGGDLSGMAGKALIAFTLFLVSFVFNVASIANNNLQDLKTGQLVEATPWKQQVALIIGVLVGAAVIPPILSQLGTVYGFVGQAGAGPAALAAPQAGLMTSLAQGVITGDLNWGLVGIGAAIGAALIVLDEVLRVAKLPRLAPLAVGLGVYLPQDVTLMIVVGAILGHIFDRYMDRRPYGESGKRLGVLLASGLIVGESLVGVVLAFLAGSLMKGGPLAAFIHVDDPTTPLAMVGDSFAHTGVLLGVVAFAAVTVALYLYTAGQARKAAA